jgi:hypothetical protein
MSLCRHAQPTSWTERNDFAMRRASCAPGLIAFEASCRFRALLPHAGQAAQFK